MREGRIFIVVVCMLLKIVGIDALLVVLESAVLPLNFDCSVFQLAIVR